jgi:ferric-dicitrate binding protein FerR (iron transport regulator)
MTPEDTPMDPALEQAISEIRGENIPDKQVDAAAERVWQLLAAQRPAEVEAPAARIRDCAGFQALFADYRAGRLPEARALLVKDHLHECVACRHAFEGKKAFEGRKAFEGTVVTLPLSGAPEPSHERMGRWAIAAGVVAVGGLAAWFAVSQYGAGSGRAMVRSINGTLYEVSAEGLRAMRPGDALAEGAEIRTARDSRATIVLQDGSLAEMRERSDLSTSVAGREITVHLDRGSVIVQAAHRRSGHLYVATADCRVAVTGTMFSVSSGVRGSRVSVVEGEVSVSGENRQAVLRPGEQWLTSDRLEPLPVREDLRWSHNTRLLGAVSALQESLSEVRLPQVRYESRLVKLLPASTVFYAAIPNLSGYLAEAGGVFRRKSAESPELRAWLAGPGAAVEPVLEKLRAANEYLGDEIVVFGTTAASSPVVLAETRRSGLAEFLRGAGLSLPMDLRSGLVLFSADPKALSVALDSTFQKTAFYQRIAQAYRRGAGLLVCADLMRMPVPPLPHGIPADTSILGAHYLIAEQKQTGERTETRATVGFDSSHEGIAGWLAPPAPIGALDYITQDATLATAFAVTDPAAVLDQAAGAISLPASSELQKQLAKTLGGEFAVALDGPPFPVPSWKLVAEVDNPAGFEAALEKWVAVYNQKATTTGGVKLRTARETVDGRVWYLLGWGAETPLSVAHYTFASGYLIAAPTRALVLRALETGANGTGLARSPSFTALLPHDSYTDFSGVIYQNLGTTLAPFAGFLGPGAGELTHLKPVLIAAYGDPGRITLASTGDLLGMSFSNFLSGSVFGIAKEMLPAAGLWGTSRAENSYR